MKSYLSVLVVVLILIVAGAACEGPPPAPPEAPAVDLGGGDVSPPETGGGGGDTPASTQDSMSGQVVTIFSAAGEDQAAALEESMVSFEEATGIDVVVETSGDFETITVARCEAGDPPDIINFPQPGLMADLARSGCLTDIGQYLSDDYMQGQYEQTWIDLGTVDGSLYGVWHNADVKSLVWYPKADFEAMGLEIPETWDELLTLTDTLSGMGVSPWCIGIESSGATGWVGTDWVEDVMLRTASPEDYDAWTRGELPFDSEQVRNAFDIVGDIWLDPARVSGGTTSILTVPFGDSPLGLFEPRSCYLHRQASFIVSFFPEGTVVGEEVDYFYLPPIDPAFGNPVLGSGSIMSQAVDNDAVRATMEYLTTGKSTEAEVKAGLFVSPHKDTPLDWYPDDVVRGFAEILQNADTFRFDGSDLMPGAVGAGTFWTGIVDWVGGADLDSVLAAIDSSWPE